MQQSPFTLWEHLQFAHPWSPKFSGREPVASPFHRDRRVTAMAADSFSNSYSNDLTPETEEERTTLRWRGTVLRLSDHFTATAAAHPELASVLLEALGNALEQLLLFGRERDLTLLEEWLDQELLSPI